MSRGGTTRAHSSRVSSSDRPIEPPVHCELCPRLVAYRAELAGAEPEWFNGAVPSFGDLRSARLLIVGLAPGARGGNRTGRTFTGDQSGDLLYSTLLDVGLARGHYGGHAGDGLTLIETVVTNAVRCVPPGNKPTAAEIATCRDFLVRLVKTLNQLQVVVALGRVAHEAIVSSAGLRKADYKFGHGARHRMNDGVVLFNSYHCSRYNTNTGRLTPRMFREVFDAVRVELSTASSEITAKKSEELADKVAENKQHKRPKKGR